MIITQNKQQFTSRFETIKIVNATFIDAASRHRFFLCFVMPMLFLAKMHQYIVKIGLCWLAK